MSDTIEAAPTTEQQTQQDKKPTLSLLASEMFGSDFKGEVDKPAAAATPEGEAEGGAAATDQEEAEPSEAAPEDGAATEGNEENSGEESGEETISSLSELIAHQGWDPEWANNLQVPVKVDGKPGQATIADLVRSYQIGQAADNRLEEAKSKAKAITDGLAEKSRDLQSQFATVARLIETLEGELDAGIKTIDWNKLREEDPAEYAAKKAEVAEQRARLEALKGEAATQWKAGIDKANAEALEALKERVQREGTALVGKIPAWADPEKAKADKKLLVDYLIGQYGFTPDDIATPALDHRVVVLGYKAMLYDKGQAKVDTAKKRVAKVPKVLKPSAARQQSQINQARVDQAHTRLKQSGSLNDAFAVLKAKRGGK